MYKEPFTNPNTGKEQQITVTEYTLDDYLKGIIGANKMSGKILAKSYGVNRSEYEYGYEYLPIEEKQKIMEAAKVLYNQRVQKQADFYKRIFQRELEQSQAKGELRELEIQALENVFINPLPPGSTVELPTRAGIQDLAINTGTEKKPEYRRINVPEQYTRIRIGINEIKRKRGIYREIIIRGEKDYTRTSYNFSEDRHYIEVEALNIYWNWLKQPETKTEQKQQTENDFTRSTIEDWLYQFKAQMTESDYQNLVSALKQYFDTGTFPTLSKPIQVNGRLNKKLFGWNLNRIFEAKGKGVEKELLLFAKQNISLFANVKFDENNILGSNLYKYFTTKTQ